MRLEIETILGLFAVAIIAAFFSKRNEVSKDSNGDWLAESWIDYEA